MVSSKLWIAAAAVMASGVAGHAQSAQSVPSEATCRAWLAHLPGVPFDGTPKVAGGVGPDTCRYEGVAIKLSRYNGVEAASVLVRGIGLDPGAVAGPVMALRAEARGVQQTIHVGNALADYLSAQQRQHDSGLTLVLDVTRDPVAQSWMIGELSVAGEHFGRVSIDGEVDGVGPIRDLDTPPPGSDGIAVRRIHAAQDSRVFVPVYLLPQFVMRLPQADTADAVDAMVRADQARLAATARIMLGAAGASQATVDAVVGVVMDFPHPAHPFEITLSATQPLTLREIDAATRAPDGPLTLAKRVAVEATYAGPFGR